MGLGTPYRIKKKRSPLVELLTGVGEGAKGYYQAKMQKKLLEAQLLGQEAEAEYKKGLLGFKEKELKSIIEGRKASQEYQQSLLGLKERQFEVGQTQADRLFVLEERKVTSLEESRTAATKLAEIAQRQGVATKMADNFAKIKAAQAKVQAATTANERDIAMAKLNHEHAVALKKIPTPEKPKSLIDKLMSGLKLKELSQKIQQADTAEIRRAAKETRDEESHQHMFEKFDYEKEQDQMDRMYDIAKEKYDAATAEAMREWQFGVRQYFEGDKLNPWTNLKIRAANNAMNLAMATGEEKDYRTAQAAEAAAVEAMTREGYQFKPAKIEYRRKSYLEARKDKEGLFGMLKKVGEVTEPPSVVFPESERVKPTYEGPGSPMDFLPAEEAPTLEAPIPKPAEETPALETLTPETTGWEYLEVPPNAVGLGLQIRRYIRKDKSVEKEGVDLPLIMAIVKKESSFDPNAEGTSGELGLMQLMEGTAKHLGLTSEERRDPMSNLAAGILYLKRLKSRFPDTAIMLAAYNAGPSRAKSPPKQTKEYISKVQRFAEAYRKDVNLLYKDLQTLHGNITGTPGKPAAIPAQTQIQDRGGLPYYQTPPPTTPQAYTIEWAIGMFVRAGRNKLKPEDIKSLKDKGFSDDEIEDIKNGLK